MPYVCFGGFENYSSKQNRCEFFNFLWSTDNYTVITTKKAIHVVMRSFTTGVAVETMLALSGLFTERRDFNKN